VVNQTTLDQLFIIKQSIQDLHKQAKKLPMEYRLPDVSVKLRLLERFLEEQIHVVGRQLEFMKGVDDGEY
jgi:hypothetical protein